MVRYHGESYEGSDDHVNDIIAANQRKKAGIMCSNCQHWNEKETYCPIHQVETQAHRWCNKFKKKD